MPKLADRHSDVNKNAGQNPNHGSSESERPLPQNLDAERSVLGAILLNNKYLAEAAAIISGRDFFLTDNGVIFTEMLAMQDAGQPIDEISLIDFLHKRGKTPAEPGGVAYISGLTDGLPRVMHVTHYAQIIKEKSRLRHLIHAMGIAQQTALDDGEEGADAILERVAATLAQLRAGQSSPGENYLDMFHSFEDFQNSSGLSFSIDGFLQNDGATMIGGLSGHGKTFVMLSIAKALLAGRGAKLWDTFPVTENAVRILYLVPESPIGPFKHRLQQLALYDYLRPDDGRLMVRTLSKGPTPCLSDPRILYAAKGSHVFLDTAVRFSAEGDENSAGDNQRGLASDIFALLASGARSVVGAHHAPKPFAKENVMRLENVLRGSGDIGAMLATCWAVKQLDPGRNIIHVENVKPRDFEPCGPFQIIGRPYIDTESDFRIHKRPGECGRLMDEHNPDRDKGGAPPESRGERNKRVGMVRDFLTQDDTLTVDQIRARLDRHGIKVSPSAVKSYRREAIGADKDTDTN